jgi:hypothetical protein
MNDGFAFMNDANPTDGTSAVTLRHLWGQKIKVDRW